MQLTYSFPNTSFEQLAFLLEGKQIRFRPFKEGEMDTVVDDEVRVIEASMIERLARSFKDSFPVSIRIENAIIKGQLNLAYVTFKGELSITNSVFLDAVDFSFATFERSVILDGSQFRERADFRAAHAVRDFRVSYAKFLKDGMFMDIRVSEVFRAEGAQFADVTFQQAVFEKRVYFCPKNPEDETAEARHVCFTGKVTFTDASIKGVAHFEGAHFSQPADFIRVQINSSAYFTCYVQNSDPDVEPVRELNFMRTCFADDVTFGGARIEGTANFIGAEFCQKADFERIRVGGHALFRAFKREENQPTVSTHFKQETSFLAANIGGNAEFDGACFDEDVYFERIEVGRNALFRSYYDQNGQLIITRFGGLVNFLGGHVVGIAEFSGAQFVGAEPGRKAWFESMSFDGNVLFDDNYSGVFVGRVLFAQEADFTNAHFSHQAVFTNACFAAEAKFINLKIEGGALFDKTEFGKGANFSSAHFLNQAAFDKSQFGADSNFTDVEIDGAAFFTEAIFMGKMIFRAARFKTLDMKGAQFIIRRLIVRGRKDDQQNRRTFKRRWAFVKQAAPGNMDLRGFTCEQINVDWDGLSQSLYPFDRQPYTLIEKAFRSAGKNIEADSVYFDLCCREGQELRDKVYRRGKFKDLKGWPLLQEIGRALRELPRALLNLAEGVGFHHGVRPYRLLVISLLVIGLGAYVFNQQGAIKLKQKPAQSVAQTKDLEAGMLDSPQSPAATQNAVAPPTFSDAINVSLNQFIPLVAIPPGDEWSPSNKPVPVLDQISIGGRVLSFAGYAALHRLFGFILIPLGVASLTGLLHRRDKG